MSSRPQQSPSLPWRMASSMVMGLTAALSRSFLYGLNSVEVIGLQRFLEVLDNRRGAGKRQRGLITVSNHVGVLDDPLVWGVLPLRYGFDPQNHRWSLGAHDICFTNKVFAAFFTAGQVLPTHRAKHSPYGGLFQPTMTQAIRLLSAQPYIVSPPTAMDRSASSSPAPEDPTAPDPFTAGTLTYSTGSGDTYPAPSAYASNRYSWIHVFPEGCVHQHPASRLRYFKWGVARLVLEAEPAAPDVVPMFIDGSQHIMPEDRKWPRFAPRIGAKVTVAFGDVLDGEAVFGDLRRRWRGLVERSRAAAAEKAGQEPPATLGDLPDDLRHGPEAVELRIEVAQRMRDEVLKVRRSLGYPDEDESAALGLAETWAEDHRQPAGRTAKKYKSKVDDSLINQD